MPRNTDWREMARALAPCFDDVAFTFANLECAVDTGGLPPCPPCGIGEIVEAPESALGYLDVLRAHIIGLANNHAYDFGGAGVERTRAAIGRCGMISIGAGCNLASPPEIYVWQGPGAVRVGFWAAAKATRDSATRNRKGVEPASLERATKACGAMLSAGANFRVALLHAGCLRTNRPDPEDVRLMDAMVRCGFDIVAASHSHRISGYNQFPGVRDRPAFCFYGLGSLVSGYAACPLEREGMVVVAGLADTGELCRVEARPARLEESGFGSTPSFPDSKVILDRFQNLSSEIADASFISRFYQDVSAGLPQLYLRDVRTAYHRAGLRGVARKASRVRMRHLRRLMHKVVG